MFVAGLTLGYAVGVVRPDVEYIENITWNNTSTQINNTEWINDTTPQYFNNTEWDNNTIQEYINNTNTEYLNNTNPEYNNITEWINTTIYLIDTAPITTPAGSWNDVGEDGAVGGKLVFGQFTQDVKPTHIKLYIIANGTEIGDITIPVDTWPTTQTMIWYSGPPTATATYFDYDGIAGTINSGDYITLTGLLPGTTYSFILHHIPSDSIIPMVGDSAEFTTPP